MDKKYYYGNEKQIRGVEEFYLKNTRGNMMSMLRVRNGKGLEIELSPERALDIIRVTFKGDNFGYFSPTGCVAPSYYNGDFLDIFTAGFLTTCGLDNVGPSFDENGKHYPQHGSLSHYPVEFYNILEDEESFIIKGYIKLGTLFSAKLKFVRTITVGKLENEIVIEDKVENIGEQDAECMLLYHINIGYPLLSEKAVLKIPSESVVGRDELANERIESWSIIEPPTENQNEVCYFHQFKENGFAAVYNEEIGKGVEISFDKEQLGCFTQWKMTGKYDYVLGLEPANCYPHGREYLVKNNLVKYLKEGENTNYTVKIKMIEEK